MLFVWSDCVVRTVLSRRWWSTIRRARCLLTTALRDEIVLAVPACIARSGVCRHVQLTILCGRRSLGDRVKCCTPSVCPSVCPSHLHRHCLRRRLNSFLFPFRLRLHKRFVTYFGFFDRTLSEADWASFLVRSACRSGSMQRCSCKCPNGQMSFLAWAVAGKPRYGPEHWLMKQTRSQFKL